MMVITNSGVTLKKTGLSLPSAILAVVLATGVVAGTPGVASAQQPPVTLGSAKTYAVTAGTAVISTNHTRIAGSVAVSPGTSVTGFPPGVVLGEVHRGDGTAAAVLADVSAAYTDAAGRTPDATVPSELGGTVKPPGAYASVDGTFKVTGVLTLDAQGDPDAVFIFQATTLTSARVSHVRLVNGAQEENVFWAVDSALLGRYTVFRGAVLASKSIRVRPGAVLHGHALAINETVIIDGMIRPPDTRLALPFRPPTVTTLTSVPNPSLSGQAVTFTATVRAVVGSTIPIGTVRFRDGTTVLGSAQQGPDGAAVFTTSSLGVGTHSVTAVFLGNAKTAINEAWVDFAPSVSNTVLQVVGP
ncbi:ice-binding family protein [Streptosporangium sp. NPDC051022]|uniref:ice-binding family protein n=1 Tax=Streptosporangium sp. NPDC051022 TaxID=3155752 RepID=UPI00342AF590